MVHSLITYGGVHSPYMCGLPCFLVPLPFLTDHWLPSLYSHYSQWNSIIDVWKRYKRIQQNGDTYPGAAEA